MASGGKKIPTLKKTASKKVDKDIAKWTAAVNKGLTRVRK